MSVSPDPLSERLPSPQKPPKKPRKSKVWRDAAKERQFVPFNPLDLENLGRSVEAELRNRAPEPLDEVSPVHGSGIYALYYCGANPLYAEISSPDCLVPVYVGQARPAGGRKGTAEEKPDATTLWDRIYEHKQSLHQAHDLEIADFRVRYLVAIEAFVSIAERVIIRHHRPVWNSIVDGFGNHDPGANRRKDSYRPPGTNCIRAAGGPIRTTCRRRARQQPTYPVPGSVLFLLEGCPKKLFSPSRRSRRKRMSATDLRLLPLAQWSVAEASLRRGWVS
ncbi:Eco29kI family restriction endonuclease [Streptomyces sp. NPDC002238]|uniref:Eco29kI family restriction endonuclease n=1 Tax=Streptomyces sp. NPDC002238 TaxID=3156649 RepID=UPI003325A322